MKTRKTISCFMLLVVMLGNFSIENSFSLTIHADDTSLNGCSTYVELPDAKKEEPYDVCIPNGETVTIVGYSSCIVVSKGEIGWYRWPTKATRSIKLSLRDQTPAILAGSLVSETKSGRKRSTENAPEVRPNLTADSSGKKIVMVDLMYPYGKQKVYLNGSLITVAAQFMAMGHQVEIVDLNIDNLTDENVQNKFRQADLIGISIIGSPYIPSAIKLTEGIAAITTAPVLMGGQVIEKLSQSQFNTMFGRTQAIRVATSEDLARTLECKMEEIPNAYQVSMIPVFQQLGDKLGIYLRHEMTLVLSQGCVFNCDFCAARKNQAEVHRGLESFTADLRFLAKAAKNAGLEQIEFYASSLDFFQNPATVAEYLRILAAIQEQENIRIRVRCLACMGSFLRASEAIPEFGQLINKAGLWCIGFGVDGTDAEVWKKQNKRHNKVLDVPRCLALCDKIGVRTEILIVWGFPEDTLQTISKNVWNTLRYVHRWPRVMLRPYLSKPFLPGNKGWNDAEPRINALMQDPRLFFNLDISAFGSRLTHPSWRHRWLCNASYALVVGLLTPIGRCATAPLLPQGGEGIKAKIAKIFNRLMECER